MLIVSHFFHTPLPPPPPLSPTHSISIQHAIFPFHFFHNDTIHKYDISSHWHPYYFARNDFILVCSISFRFILTVKEMKWNAFFLLFGAPHVSSKNSMQCNRIFPSRCENIDFFLPIQKKKWMKNRERKWFYQVHTTAMCSIRVRLIGNAQTAENCGSLSWLELCYVCWD